VVIPKVIPKGLGSSQGLGGLVWLRWKKKKNSEQINKGCLRFQ
jgi:hypothetical protein